MTGLRWLALFGMTGGVVYWLAARLALARWLAEPEPEPGATPPVSFLRPIKRGSPRLRDLLELHAAALRPEDELVLGVEEAMAIEAAEAVAARWPQRRIVVVRCGLAAGGNPKVAKLEQMSGLARHEDWILCDSELRCDEAFAEALRREWAQAGVAVLTCGYRMVGAETWPQRLDAAAVWWTLWPGLAVVRGWGRPRFALGACTAVRAGDVAAIGGWAALRGELADDHQLGARLAAMGRRVRLTRTVATLESDALSWGEWWRHQRRVAVTYRACAPLGFAGQVFTHAVSWAVVWVLAMEGWRSIDLMVAGMVAIVAVMVGMGRARALGFDERGAFLVVPVAAVVESVCWLLAWPVRRVWWGGRWRRVGWRGGLSD